MGRTILQEQARSVLKSRLLHRLGPWPSSSFLWSYLELHGVNQGKDVLPQPCRVGTGSGPEFCLTLPPPFPSLLKKAEMPLI